MYIYETMKSKIFTDEGQRQFLKVRDRVNELLEKSGSFIAYKVFIGLGSFDNWMELAYMDRLVELGEIEEVKRDCALSDRIFIRKK